MRHLAPIATALLAAIPALAGQIPKAAVAPSPEPCPAQGNGFVRLPGSHTCIRLSGRVVTDGTLRAGREGAAAVPTSAGRFAIDTRTDSGVGEVRTYLRIGNGRR